MSGVGTEAEGGGDSNSLMASSAQEKER